MLLHCLPQAHSESLPVEFWELIDGSHIEPFLPAVMVLDHPIHLEEGDDEEDIFVSPQTLSTIR